MGILEDIMGARPNPTGMTPQAQMQEVMGIRPNPTGMTPQAQMQGVAGSRMMPAPTTRGNPSFIAGRDAPLPQMAPPAAGRGALSPQMAPPAPAKPSFGQKISNFFSDEDKVAKLILALEPLRGPGGQGGTAAKWAQGHLQNSRETNLLNQQSNKTIEFLRAKGVDPKLLESAKNNPTLLKALVEQAFEKPDKPSESPTLVKEYEYAVSQGFEGSLTDFVASKRAPTDTYTPLTREEKAAMDLDVDKLYQRSALTGKVVGEGGMNVSMATEGERKTGLLASRLETAQNQIISALNIDPEAESPEFFPTIFSKVGFDMLATAFTSDQRQIIESAQRDMLDAALTLGTGAAYTAEQIDGYRMSYFPQIGDSEQTIKAKRSRLEQLIKTAKQAAGRGQITNVSQLSPNRASVSGNVVVFPDGTSYVFPDLKTASEAANEFNNGGTNDA